jgi:hypothetical protein
LIETQSLIAVFKMDSGVRPVFFAIAFKSMILAISISSRSETNERPRFAILAAMDQQPRHMFFVAASVRAFSALSGSTTFPGSDAG